MHMPVRLSTVTILTSRLSAYFQARLGAPSDPIVVHIL